ncbi:MAG: c-type cytochrome [Mariprofundus sp.]|nr:c-type cytochrome [Mariprofundus sp.]
MPRFIAIIYIALFSPFCTAILAADAHATDNQAVDAARGKVVATVRCMPCHHLDSHARSIGPGLKGVYGRAPTIIGVPFEVWDDAALEAWLSGPRKIKPNTRMSMPSIAARDRADLIAYFKSDVGK